MSKRELHVVCEGECCQDDEESGGGCVQENVERVRADAVAFGEKGVSAAEHLLIAGGARGIGSE